MQKIAPRSYNLSFRLLQGRFGSPRHNAVSRDPVTETTRRDEEQNVEDEADSNVVTATEVDVVSVASISLPR